MTVGQALGRARRVLKHAEAVHSLDAEILLAHVTKRSRTRLLGRPERRLTASQSLRYFRLVWRRLRGHPLAYLTHHQAFYDLDFRVNRHVLIPRPETELLVEQARQLIERTRHTISTVVDIGTGSGCLAVSIARLYPLLRVVATDQSAAALRCARRNAHQLLTTKNISFMRGDLLQPLHRPSLNREAHSTLVLANLPYLRNFEYVGSLRAEPRTALVGGIDGLLYYRRFFTQLAQLELHHRPRFVLLELHPPTALAVAALAKHLLGVTGVIIPDLGHRPRVLKLTLG